MSYLDEVKELVKYINDNRDLMVVWHEYELEKARDILIGIKTDIVHKRKL